MLIAYVFGASALIGVRSEVVEDDAPIRRKKVRRDLGEASQVLVSRGLVDGGMEGEIRNPERVRVGRLDHLLPHAEVSPQLSQFLLRDVLRRKASRETVERQAALVQIDHVAD